MRRTAPITGNRAAGAFGRVTQKPKPPEPPRPPKKAPLPPRKPKHHRPNEPEEPMPEKTTQPEPTEDEPLAAAPAKPKPAKGNGARYQRPNKALRDSDGHRAFRRLIDEGVAALSSANARFDDAVFIANNAPEVAERHARAMHRLAQWEEQAAAARAAGKDTNYDEYERRLAVAKGTLYQRLICGARIEDMTDEEVDVVREIPWRMVRRAAKQGGNEYLQPPYTCADWFVDGWFLDGWFRAWIKWHPHKPDTKEELEDTYKTWLELRKAKRVPRDIIKQLRADAWVWRTTDFDPAAIPSAKDWLLAHQRVR